ncbi:VOC family protein [Dietzia sp.]|uniref:VOC family protein n=1 Tax=Dietzia sp. TaxID=1871616 RepID=UPI002FDB3AB0
MSIRRAVPILSVADVPAAVAEYREILDVEVLMDHGWIATLGSPAAAKTVPAPQFSVMSRDATAPCNPELSLELDDPAAVDAAHARAVAAGAEIVHPPTVEPWGVRRFFYRDVGGHVVNVLAHL